MPRISSPRPLDLTKPFVTSSQSDGSQPFDLSQNLVTWYRDIKGDFVPDLSGRGNTARIRRQSFQPVTSSDNTPEFNSKRYEIKSFGFGLGSDSMTAAHLTTSGSILGNVSMDHSFNENSADIPFSVSLWIKPDALSGGQYIVSKVSAAGFEWQILLSSNTIYFYLYTSSGSNYIRAYSVAGVTVGEWQHFTFTYDGSKSATGLTIYKNGVISPGFNRSSAAPYTGMTTTQTPLCVGSYFTNLISGAVTYSDRLRGELHSLAIWKNRALNITEIQALYYAYVNGSGGNVKSGLISKSPRLQLRELDDHPSSYPTVLRTGDATRAGSLKTNFDDETSIVFSQSGNVVFPAMLPKGSSFMSQAVDIIGQESDISASLPIRSFQQPNHLHYSPVEEIGPFDENRVMPANDFFLSGTDPRVLPGFSSPVRSKIAIEIDISPRNQITLTRNVASRNISESQPSSNNNSGFYYYNFSKKDWEQVGLTDPATGGSTYFDYDLSSGPLNISSSFLSQFSNSPCVAYAPDDEKERLGYSKIGTPISAHGAPNNYKYHATSSQALKMSEYISDPFLLESVKVELGSVRAQRVDGNSYVPPQLDDGYQTGWEYLFNSGAIRDIDNYVFFAYRQKRNNRVVDSVSDVSSSNRYLIFSGSLTFWNSPSFESNQVRYESLTVNKSLTHNPAFEYDFNLPYSSSLDRRLTDWDPANETYFYRDIPVNTIANCVAHFNFETTKIPGETVPDKSGNGHIATLQGDATVYGPEYEDFPGKNVFDFYDKGAYITNRGYLDLSTDATSANDILLIDHASDLQMTSGNELLICFWMRNYNFGSVSWILSKSDSSGAAEYAILINAGDNVEFRVYDTSSTFYTTSYIGRRTNSSPFSSTEWHHYTFRYTGGTTSSSLLIYVDGVRVTSTTSTTTGATFTAPKNISAPVRVGAVGDSPSTIPDAQVRIGSLEFYSSLISPQILFLLQTAPNLNTLGKQIGTFTGSISFETKPAVVNQQSFGVSNYHGSYLQNGWIGGTSAEVFKTTGWGNYLSSTTNPFILNQFNRMFDPSLCRPKFDSHSQKMLGNDSNNNSVDETQMISGITLRNDDALQSSPSTYLLLPDDELIFGFDAGISQIPWQFVQGYLSTITGSHMVIDSKPCKVTLYGSLIKNQSENLSTLNQNLSSDSVHEIVGSEPVLDQYRIEPVSSYYGSRLDEIVTGSMLTPVLGGIFFTTASQDQSRRVVSRISVGQAGSTGSFQRFVNLNDSNERTYDSCLPDPFALFHSGATIRAVGAEYGVPELVVDDIREYRSWLKTQFPYEGNPQRQKSIGAFELYDERTGMVKSSYGVPGVLDYALVHLFKVGWSYDGNFAHRHSSTYQKTFENGKAFRYGISNIKPEFSSCCWNSNHYGHMRDLLEPRRYFANSDGAKPIKISFVSGSSRVDPMLTYSQNLSTFATSSMPYFDDGVARNRPDNPDESLVEVIA